MCLWAVAALLCRLEIQSHAAGGVIANHPPTFTLNNNGIPHFADRAFVEDGGVYYAEQWACGVSDCNGGGQTLNFKFRLLNITRPNPDDVTLPYWAVDREQDSMGEAFFTTGPVGTAKRDGDSMDPGGAVGNLWPDPNLCDGLPLIPCYAAGGPDDGDTGYGTLTFEAAPDRWGLAFFEVWLEDDGIAFPLNNIPCHCRVDMNPCPAAPVNEAISVPCNQQCNRQLSPGNPTQCNHQIFAINILPVNDPPSFVPTPTPITSLENTQQTIQNFACDIDHGGWNEWPYQEVAFTITTSDPTFFSTQPEILPVPPGEQLPCRDLTYVLAEGKCGIVEVTVQPHDDGGESSVGEPYTFSMIVVEVNSPPVFTVGSMVVEVEESRVAGVERVVSSFMAGIEAEPYNSCDQGDFITGVALSGQTAGCDAKFDVPPAIDLPSGNLRFTPHQFSSSGPDGCCYAATLTDSHQATSDETTFCIVLTEVNDLPTFTTTGDVTTCQNSPSAMTQWAASICPGGLPTSLQCDHDEAAVQEVVFAASTESVQLFSTLPSIDGNGVLSYTVAQGKSGTATVYVQATDTGNPPATTSTSFVLTVESVNSPPTAVVSQRVVTVEEDVGDVRVSRWVTGVSPGLGDVHQTVDVIGCHSDRPGMFSLQPELSLMGTVGDLVFSTRNDQNGVAEVVCTLSDNGGVGSPSCPGNDTATLHLTIVILPIDDPPEITLAQSCVTPEWSCSGSTVGSCTGGASGGSCTTQNIVTKVIIDEDEGVVNLRNIIMEFSGGPADEDQEVSFEVGTSGDAVFSPNAAVRIDAATGTLSFETRPDAHGEAVVSVTAIDSGGNRSPTASIQLVVTPVNDPPTLTLSHHTLVIDACYTSPCPILTFPSFAASTPGPLNEAAQHVSLYVTASDPSWFTSPPRVTPSGLLEFSLTADVDTFPPGSSEQSLAITARDDAGGLDSTSETVVLIVVATTQPPTFSISPIQLVTSEDPPDIVRVHRWARDVTGEGLRFDCTLEKTELLKIGTRLKVDVETGDMTFEVAEDAFGDTTGSCRLVNSAGSGAVETFPFSITAVNDCPTIDLVAGQVTVYDISTTTVKIVTSTSAGPNEEHQAVLHKVVTNTKPGFFTVPPRVDSQTGELILDVIPGVVGPVVLTVTAVDNGGTLRGGCDTSKAATVHIMVLHANRPPTFNIHTPRVEAREDVGPVTIERFLSDIDPGGAADSTQSVSCRVITPTTFFTTPPSITSGTSLTFTSKPDVFGEYIFEVQCEDSGLSSPPHASTSATTTFSVNILGVNDAPHFEFARENGVEAWEDSGKYELPGFMQNIVAGPVNERDVQEVVVFCEGEGGLVENLVVALQTINNGLQVYDANLVFDVLPEVSGKATLRCCAVDSGGGEANQFCDDTDITIHPINDSPDFTLNPYIELPEATASTPPTITIRRFLHGVVPGPDEEWSQDVFPPVISTESSMVFTSIPLLSPTPSLAGERGLSYDLQINLVTGLCGVVTGTVSVTDSGGTTTHPSDSPATTTQHFTISVLCANDPPNYVPGGEKVVVCEDTVTYSVPWATQITPGYREEAAQDVEFVLTPITECRILTKTPELTRNGTLVVEAASDRWGSCGFAVVLRDSLQKVSLVKSELVVEVVEVNDKPIFNVGQTVVTVEQGGEKVEIPHWCSDVNLGNHEGHQTADFITTLHAGPSDIDSYFTTPPYVSVNNCSLILQPSPDYHGNFTFKITLRDSSGRASHSGCTPGSDTSDPVLLDVVIVPRYAAPIVVLSNSTLSIFEDANPATIPNLISISLPTMDSPVTMSLHTDENHLFQHITLVNNINLSLQPTRDAVGVARVVFYAESNGLVSQEVVLHIRVLPVNDKPSCKPGPVVVGVEGGGEVFVPRWATDIVVGPEDEVGQVVVFVVVFDDWGQWGEFAVPPHVTRGGDLTFELLPDSFGEFAFTVVVEDSGGGANRSDPYPLRISVQNDNDPPVLDTVLTSITTNNTAGPQSRIYATKMTPGPSNEAYQTLSTVVDVVIGGHLFTSPLTLHTSGVFSFTPSPTTSGHATVKIHVVDSEGAISDVKTLEISVLSSPTGGGTSFGATFTAQTTLEKAEFTRLLSLYVPDAVLTSFSDGKTAVFTVGTSQVPDVVDLFSSTSMRDTFKVTYVTSPSGEVIPSSSSVPSGSDSTFPIGVAIGIGCGVLFLSAVAVFGWWWYNKTTTKNSAVDDDAASINGDGKDAAPPEVEVEGDSGSVPQNPLATMFSNTEMG